MRHPDRPYHDGQVVVFRCNLHGSELDERSYQRVTITAMTPRSIHHYRQLPEYSERIARGTPATYQVQFSDGHRAVVFEDELFLPTM